MPVVDLLGAVLQDAVAYKMMENAPRTWAISYNITNNTSFTLDDLRWVTTAGQMHVLLQDASLRCKCYFTFACRAGVAWHAALELH